MSFNENKANNKTLFKKVSVTSDDHIELPDVWDLAESIHFNHTEGHIWLDDRRALLFRAESFHAFRQSMIDTFGPEATRGLFTRAGYISGSRDAMLALKIRGEMTAVELLAAGAQLHGLQGITAVEPLRVDLDSTTGTCHVDMLWRHSVECDHRAASGGEPTCWMAAGHVSGFLSTIMGKRILVREVECRSAGAQVCRAVAMPVELWDEPERDLKYMDPSAILKPRATGVAPRPAADQGLNFGPVCSHNGVIVGSSAALQATLHRIRRVAPTDATVLLLGESGVGKSMFAREIHAQSRRASRPFVEVNCAAIPEQLVESELFGVERGAYSGAVESRAGRFEVADGGAIFLDEIATLSFAAQGKLLRILQNGEMERLGSAKTKIVDVRIIAATNENLTKAVKENKFREDLFFRLNVFPIKVEPLRERRDDIPLLTEYFTNKFSKKHGRRCAGITAKALQIMLNYNWPGNIREFENVIERSIILLDDGEHIDAHHLYSFNGAFTTSYMVGLNRKGALAPRSGQTCTEPAAELNGSPGDLGDWADNVIRTGATNLSDIEDALVRAAIRGAGGNISQAASLLGITRHQMDYRAKKLQCPPEQERGRDGQSRPAKFHGT